MNKWIIFDWFLAVIPVFVVAFGFWLWNGRCSLDQILGDGQLYFFCTGLAAAAFGDLLEIHAGFTAATPSRIQQAINPCLTGLVFVIVFSSCFYGLALHA